MANMFKLSLRALRANLSRLALTALTIILGVGFVVAAFLLGDSLRSAFGGLTQEIVAGTDLQVRVVDEFGVDSTLTSSELEAIRNTDGVDAAEPFVGTDRVQIIDGSGELRESVGPPQFGFSWTPDQTLSQFTLVDGRAPEQGEMVIDVGMFGDGDFVLGKTYEVLSPHGRFDFELVGTTSFGENNESLGAEFILFEVSDAGAVSGAALDEFDEISIAVADDRTASDVQRAIETVLPAGIEVVNQQTVQEETASDFNAAINILEYVLTGFAVVALFVSTFIIYNTFGMLLAQRVRELGLLRAVGASTNQIRGGVVFEAVIVGLVASALGLLAGIGLQLGVGALFDALGVGLPETEFVLRTRTVVAAFGLGLGVTVLSAIAPAIRASRVAPVTAMSGHASAPRTSTRGRLVIGAIAATLSLALGAYGLFVTDNTTTGLIALGAGIVGVFLSTTLLSPIIAPAVVGVVGWPLRKLFGVSGNLAVENAQRNPRRTSTTAAALMVGLALVTTALIVGQSLKAELGQTLDETVQADYVISTPSFNPMSPAITADLASVPEIGSVMQVAYEDIRVNGDDLELVGVTMATVDDLVNLSMQQGQVPIDGGAQVLIGLDLATERGWSVGDLVMLDFANGTNLNVAVSGIYDESWVFEGATLIDFDQVLGAVDVSGPSWIAAELAAGVSANDAQGPLAEFGDRNPQVNLRSDAEYREEIEGQIDQLLNIITAMLALAILIALIGIGLTLALSVFERTRELGLLRAVGMTRGQLRRMVRWEAALVALFGALLGVGIGLLFGWAAAAALPETVTSTVSVPVLRLAVLVAISVAAGLIAALMPARRAGRLNVLDAIATQ